MPAPSPSWTGEESQLPHCPTAIFSASAAEALDPLSARIASPIDSPFNDRTRIAASPLDLLRRDVRRLDDLTPGDALGTDAGAEILRTVADQPRAGFAEPLLHGGCTHRCGDRLVQTLDD